MAAPPGEPHRSPPQRPRRQLKAKSHAWQHRRLLARSVAAFFASTSARFRSRRRCNTRRAEPSVPTAGRSRIVIAKRRGALSQRNAVTSRLMFLSHFFGVVRSAYARNPSSSGISPPALMRTGTMQFFASHCSFNIAIRNSCFSHD